MRLNRQILGFSFCPARRAAFSLMEILLVVVIISIAVAVSMPYLSKSIKGNRLRTAGRSVVQLARYARSMAVLNQAECSLKFDPGGSTVTVAGPGIRGESPSRTLDRVKIISVTLGGRNEFSGGVTSPVYRRTGRCTPYTVTLQDEDQRTMVIRVDAVGGIQSGLPGSS